MTLKARLFLFWKGPQLGPLGSVPLAGAPGALEAPGALGVGPRYIHKVGLEWFYWRTLLGFPGVLMAT